jgi:membrane protease YdiL (CAAX protease family)
VAVDILLGLAYGWITQRTDTLWGAVLAHAAADAFLMLGGLAVLSGIG